MGRQKETGLRDVDTTTERLLADLSEARLMSFGLLEYRTCLAVQESLREERTADRIPDTWLIGEHPTVITQGVRGREEDLRGGGKGETPTPVVQIDRGGMTTLHSPGQMILYPIVKLGGGSLTAGRMTHALLRGMRVWLIENFGIESEIPPGRPGLYAAGRKLMSVGISVRQAVTMHGIAINLCNDLELWRQIVACGEPGTVPVSLSEILGKRVSPQEQRDSIQSWLQSFWGYGCVRVDNWA